MREKEHMPRRIYSGEGTSRSSGRAVSRRCAVPPKRSTPTRVCVLRRCTREMQAADEGRHARQLRDVHNRDIHEERATNESSMMRSQRRHLRAGERRATVRRVQLTSTARRWTGAAHCLYSAVNSLPAFSLRPCPVRSRLSCASHVTLPRCPHVFSVAVPAQCFRLCALIVVCKFAQFALVLC